MFALSLLMEGKITATNGKSISIGLVIEIMVPTISAILCSHLKIIECMYT